MERAALLVQEAQVGAMPVALLQPVVIQEQRV